MNLAKKAFIQKLINKGVAPKMAALTVNLLRIKRAQDAKTKIKT
jgi:hypothetical protein